MRACAMWLVCMVGGCLELSLVPCADIACPIGSVCTPGGCASPADVAACDGLADGTPCHAASGGGGTCQGGACRTGLCGNGEIDASEMCDDGNQLSGDGCRADCAKAERCGDAELDEGEACDDGNINPADGCDACVVTAWQATALVGSAMGATTTGGLGSVIGVAVDGLGRVFLSDTNNQRIRRVEVDGTITTVAGAGVAGFGGDGGQATNALLAFPGLIAVDGLGRVFISDTGNNRVRRIDIDGTITTIAGTGTPGDTGDGGPATNARLTSPRGIAVDGLGRVFVAAEGNYRVRQIDVDGTITTVAGTGAPGSSLDGIPATSAALARPFGVAVDSSGRVLIVDVDDARVRRVELDGTITTVAGDGTPGFGGDGSLATSAQLFLPHGVAVDALDRIVIVDSGNHRVRRVELDGTIATLAGTGGFGGAGGFGGDGGAATAAQVQFPFDAAVDGLGRLLIADTLNLRIRRVELDGTIGTLAGTGAQGTPGDGGAATSAPLAKPSSIAIDAMGRLVIVDPGDQISGPFNNCIRRIDADGIITTIAGQAGSYGYAGDNGIATLASLSTPTGVTIDGSGRVLIADAGNQVIRRIALNGTISTLAGTGTVAGYSGDLGAATLATLSNPSDIAVDAPGRVMIADTGNHAIRRLQLDGTIRTIAGTGTAGFSADGTLAASAQLSGPLGVAVDGSGRVLIADTGNHVIRRIEFNATITTIAGTGTPGFSGDLGQATSGRLSSPSDVAVDGSGRVLIADTGNHAVRRIELDGTIVTIAGTGIAGVTGDGAVAAGARLDTPVGVAVDSVGRVVIADTGNDRVRMIGAGGDIITIAGAIDPGNTGPVEIARLASPQAIEVGSAITLVASGTTGTLEAIRNGRVEVVAGRYPQSLATGTLARFRDGTFGSVGGLAFDPIAGVIYLSETSSNRLQVISQVDPSNPATWTIAPLANTAGTAGVTDGDAATARFRSPGGLFLDAAAHMLYIADTGNHAVRALDLVTYTVTTIVNTSHRLGFAGDGGPAAGALLFQPAAITRCAGGDLFIADTGNNRVRRITSTGTIDTVLGDGVAASSGEGHPASTFPVNAPRGLACDAFGNLFVTSSTTVRLLAASDTGSVDGTGSVQTIYGPSPQFPASLTSCLTGLSVTGPMTLQVADVCTGLLVELARTTKR